MEQLIKADKAAIYYQHNTIIALSIFISGLILIILGAIRNSHTALFLGATLVGLSLLKFPAFLVALATGGYFLYFLLMQYIGIFPYTDTVGEFMQPSILLL